MSLVNKEPSPVMTNSFEATVIYRNVLSISTITFVIFGKSNLYVLIEIFLVQLYEQF